MKTWTRLGLALAAAAAIPACSKSDDGAPPTSGYRQIEQLARPAINEGLFFTQDFLNAYNTLAPSQQEGAIAATPALAAEAVAVIDAVDMADGVDDSPATAIIGALIPDVMRINAANAATAPVGTPAYNFSFNPSLTPMGGRKIEDDVIDITLSILLKLDATGGSLKDNVSYQGVVGNEAQPGHKKLHGQAAYNGTATFPFLAKPN
jgi:uncharacterized protein DUF4331